MTMSRPTFVLLRVLLVLLFGILVVLQTLSLPGQFSHMAEVSPELAHLRWPLTAIAVFLVLCAQVVVVSTWKLLTLVIEGRVFSDEAFVWVNGIVAALAGVWLVLVVGGAYLAIGADDPSTPLLLLFLSTVLTIVTLLMLVMRSLLRQATSLRSDLEAVI